MAPGDDDDDDDEGDFVQVPITPRVFMLDT